LKEIAAITKKAKAAEKAAMAAREAEAARVAQKEGGILVNKRHQMSKERYRAAGGTD